MNLNENFFDLMEQELINNSYKGDWKKWEPSPEEWLWQMTYHLFKLQKAIQENEKSLIKEFSLDVANLAEKSYTQFGIKE